MTTEQRLVFVPMTEPYLAEVMVNEKLSYSHPWSESIFSDCIKSGHECWLVQETGKAIGHSVLSVAAGESHLQNVCIRPERQGLGYGRVLVAHMIERARANEVSQIFLEVRPSNLAAYKLYEAMGFNEIGVRKNYYPAEIGREDAIIFAMHLFYES